MERSPVSLTLQGSMEGGLTLEWRKKRERMASPNVGESEDSH